MPVLRSAASFEEETRTPGRATRAPFWRPAFVGQRDLVLIGPRRPHLARRWITHCALGRWPRPDNVGPRPPNTIFRGQPSKSEAQGELAGKTCGTKSDDRPSSPAHLSSGIRLGAPRQKIRCPARAETSSSLARRSRSRSREGGGRWARTRASQIGKALPHPSALPLLPLGPGGFHVSGSTGPHTNRSPAGAADWLVRATSRFVFRKAFSAARRVLSRERISANVISVSCEPSRSGERKRRGHRPRPSQLEIDASCMKKASTAAE
jgi:hypothetical protein